MEFEMPKSKVYIKTDTEGRILRCEGGYTTPADLTGWAYIDEGTGDRYNLAQSHYFAGGLYNDDGIPRYKWDGTQAILRTEDEIEADRASIPYPEPESDPEPTELEQLRADVDYIAMETGVEL